MVITDFDTAQIKALKTCEIFDSKPYVVPCLFHYSKMIMKKFKELKILKKKINKRERIISFYIGKISSFIEFYKQNIFLSENEKKFISY